MEMFWSIVIAALFVVAVVALLVVGARYLKIEKQTDQGPADLQSSRDNPDHRAEEKGRKLEERVQRREARDEGERAQPS